jgi:hypothetical protein
VTLTSGGSELLQEEKRKEKKGKRGKDRADKVEGQRAAGERLLAERERAARCASALAPQSRRHQQRGRLTALARRRPLRDQLGGVAKFSDELDEDQPTAAPAYRPLVHVWARGQLPAPRLRQLLVLAAETVDPRAAGGGGGGGPGGAAGRQVMAEALADVPAALKAAVLTAAISLLEHATRSKSLAQAARGGVRLEQFSTACAQQFTAVRS